MLFDINAKLIVKKPLLVMNSLVPSIGSISQYLVISTSFKLVMFSSDIILSLGNISESLLVAILLISKSAFVTGELSSLIDTSRFFCL